MFVWPGCRTHYLSFVAGGEAEPSPAATGSSLLSTFTFAFFLSQSFSHSSVAFGVFLINTFVWLPPSSSVQPSPVPSTSCVKDFLSLVLFIPTVSLSHSLTHSLESPPSCSPAPPCPPPPGATVFTWPLHVTWSQAKTPRMPSSALHCSRPC